MQTPQIQQTKPTPTPSGQDKLAYAVFWGTLGGGTILNGVMVFFIMQALRTDMAKSSVDWLHAGFMFVSLLLALFLLRAVIWGAFVLGAGMASRTQSWAAQTKICTWAMKVRDILPGGASWAAQAIIQQLMTRGEYEEVIDLGTREYELMVSRKSKDHTLALLCSCVGLAYQSKNENHRAIEWNERSAEQFKAMFASLDKNAKKLAGQGLVDQLSMQYAGVYANLGALYLALGNKAKAKENFKLSMEQARKLPDSAQKRELVEKIQEQLTRLKRW